MTLIQDSKLKHGLYMSVASDGLEAQSKVEEKIYALRGIRKKSVKLKAVRSMSLKELAKEMKPEVEKLVKEARIKSDLLDVIKKIPIN